MAKIDNLDWSEERHLNRSLIEELCECDWIDSERKLWVLLYGASGCGKSFLAQVFDYAACLNGYSTRYIRTPLLAEEMQEAIEKRRITAYRKTLNNRKLLILDDFGLGNINDTVGENLLTIIDERLDVSSLIICSQIHPSSWHEYFCHQFRGDAFLDRVLNQCYKIELSGRSLREKYGAASFIGMEEKK